MAAPLTSVPPVSRNRNLATLGTQIAKHIDGVAQAYNTVDVDSFAVFSAKERYRYFLSRQWSRKLPLIVVMLNPSTANAFKNDPTVQIIENLARRDGFGGFVVLNICAFRSTNPKHLLVLRNPFGKHNTFVTRFVVKNIQKQWKTTPIVLLAYGANIHKIKKAPAYVANLLTFLSNEASVKYLALCKDQTTPRHPLYLARRSMLQDYKARTV